ncbi:MAG: hypothetical protein NVS4B2_23560 [Chloroflexota bacterium]
MNSRTALRVSCLTISIVGTGAFNGIAASVRPPAHLKRASYAGVSFSYPFLSNLDTLAASLDVHPQGL